MGADPLRPAIRATRPPRGSPAVGELGDLKAQNCLATGADVIVTSNPGCLLQIGAGLGRAGNHTRVLHIVEVVDAAIRGTPSTELLGPGHARVTK